MKKEVTFIYPGISGSGFNSFGKSVDSSWISHGLSLLSSSLKEKEFSVNLLDLRKLSGWSDFESQFKKIKPSLVGVTMMSVDFNPAVEAIKILKRINPGTLVFVGGAHPTLAPEELLPIPEIDYLFIGEGEITFPLVAEKVLKGKKIERMVRGEKPDLDKIPFADRDLFGAFEKPLIPEFPEPFVSIICGRGCLYNCRFCKPAEDKLFGKGVRRRSAENVISELKILRKKYHFKSLMIHDDCLTEDREWVREFCDLYQREGFHQPFICQTRADIVVRNPEMVSLMRKAGLYLYLIGFESGSQRVLNFIRKGTTVSQNYEAARICRQNGIKIWANYMVGLPTETKREVMETVRMIQKIKPDYYSPAFFTPHPGSDLYDYCLKNNLSLIKNHDQYRRDPYGEKIKGQDYDFLRKAVGESEKIGFGQRVKRYFSKRAQKLIFRLR